MTTKEEDDSSQGNLERLYEGKDLADFPLYEGVLSDILPAEHYLWQMKESCPDFDTSLRVVYAELRDTLGKDAKSWPENVLIPADIYTNIVVVPQRIGLLADDLTLVSQREKSRIEIPEPPVRIASGVEPMEGPESYYNSETGENYEDVLADVHSRLSVANWEAYKDVVRYDAADFEAIAAGREGLDGLIPDALREPLNTMGFWISLAGIGFAINSETCLGCFVFRGADSREGGTLNAGFLTRNSYYDYTIPLTGGATLDYILESEADYYAESCDAEEDEAYRSEQRRLILEEMSSTWRRILPVIVHAFRNLAKCPALRGRATGKACIGRATGPESATVTHWRWDSGKGSFKLTVKPSLLRGPYRRDFLLDFLDDEETGPYEVPDSPDTPPTLN